VDDHSNDVQHDVVPDYQCACRFSLFYLRCWASVHWQGTFLATSEQLSRLDNSSLESCSLVNRIPPQVGAGTYSIADLSIRASLLARRVGKSLPRVSPYGAFDSHRLINKYGFATMYPMYTMTSPPSNGGNSSESRLIRGVQVNACPTATLCGSWGRDCHTLWQRVGNVIPPYRPHFVTDVCDGSALNQLLNSESDRGVIDGRLLKHKPTSFDF